MHKHAKFIIGAIAVVLLIVAGTLLPGELALGRDRMIFGQIQIDPLDAAELADYIHVSMVDKVSLLGLTSGTMQLQLKTGAVYDEDTIREKFIEELQKLYELRFYPRPAAKEFDRFSSAVALHIRNDAPAINMIVWEISFRADNLSGLFYLDDDTGKILSFAFSGTGHNSLVYTNGKPEEWASYLGAEMKNKQRGPKPDDMDDETIEISYLFELYSGPLSVCAQLSSSIQGAAGKTNRWSLNYLQMN